MKNIPIKVKNLKELPEGQAEGIIIRSELGVRDFKQGDGPQQVLMVAIQPRNPEDGEYPELEMTFKPALNPMSALGKFLDRIGESIDFATTQNWDEKSILGTEVQFETVHNKINGVNFSQIQKDTVRAL